MLSCTMGYVLVCSGERVALWLRQAARDVDPHQHGGHEREDSSTTLRALQEEKTGTGDYSMLLYLFLCLSVYLNIRIEKHKNVTDFKYFG